MAITRRNFLAAVSLGPSALSTALLPQRTRRKNVVFVVSDDLNRALGTYGHPIVRSPHLDRVAQRGVVFERAYCQFPMCQPSRTSFLSGMRPDSTGVLGLRIPTRVKLKDHLFLPEYFRKHGYYTAMSGKVYHTGEYAEDPRSWDEEYREFGKSPEREDVIEDDKGKGPQGHNSRWAKLRLDDAEMPDGNVARRAVQLMEKAQRNNTPFFLGVGFRRPHAPYAAPKKYFDMYPPDRLPLPKTPRNHFDRLLYSAVNHEPPAEPMSEAVVRQYLSAYYASVTFMDAQLGVLLDGLDRLKLWDSTVVLFVSDHGYHIGDHGGLWHKTTLFDQALCVPLVVASPGQRAVGKRSERIVELVDMYATLTELCGLPSNDVLEGSSFAPLLDQPHRKWKRAAFAVQTRGKQRKSATMAMDDIEYLGRSVCTERWRYTEWDGGKRGVELYDHASDPDELNNLAALSSFSAVEAEMRQILRAGWKASRPPRA
ncbi:MAG: sulfatase-like hydrolase/transferase [Luteitalea sp.]|nr:sulfatase-like hydrolase/transferase [Luteitalea sp.]